MRAGLRQLGVRRDEYEKGARSVARPGLILEKKAVVENKAIKLQQQILVAVFSISKSSGEWIFI